MKNTIKHDHTASIIISILLIGLLSICIGAWVLLLPFIVIIWLFVGTTWIIITLVAALLTMFIIGC